MILVTFVPDTAACSTGPAAPGSLQGSHPASTAAVQYQNFCSEYFLSLDYLSYLTSATAHLSVWFFFSRSFSQSFVSDFRLLTVSCDTGWKYSSPLWLLIDSIVLGYFPNFTWLLSVAHKETMPQSWSYLSISGITLPGWSWGATICHGDTSAHLVPAIIKKEKSLEHGTVPEHLLVTYFSDCGYWN